MDTPRNNADLAADLRDDGQHEAADRIDALAADVAGLTTAIDLLAERRGSHDPTTAAGKSLLADRPPRTDDLRDIDPQPSVHEASSSERLNWFARKAQRTELLGLLEDAWGIIANAGPIEVGPPTASPGWPQAALRFRAQYHDLLRRLHPSPMVEPARTEEELEDELLDARAAQAMAEYQERTGLTAEEVAAKTARGLLATALEEA